MTASPTIAIGASNAHVARRVMESALDKLKMHEARILPCFIPETGPLIFGAKELKREARAVTMRVRELNPDAHIAIGLKEGLEQDEEEPQSWNAVGWVGIHSHRLGRVTLTRGGACPIPAGMAEDFRRLRQEPWEALMMRLCEIERDYASYLSAGGRTDRSDLFAPGVHFGLLPHKTPSHYLHYRSPLGNEAGLIGARACG